MAYPQRKSDGSWWAEVVAAVIFGYGSVKTQRRRERRAGNRTFFSDGLERPGLCSKLKGSMRGLAKEKPIVRTCAGNQYLPRFPRSKPPAKYNREFLHLRPLSPNQLDGNSSSHPSPNPLFPIETRKRPVSIAPNFRRAIQRLSGRKAVQRCWQQATDLQ